MLRFAITALLTAAMLFGAPGLFEAPGLSAAPIPRDATKVNYFPLSKGSTWNYTADAEDPSASFAVNITESAEKNGRIVSTLKYQFDGSDQSEQMATDAAGVYRASEGNFDKPIVVLKYPLAAGSTWESKMPLGGASPTAKAKVKGVVEIEVPAGKFSAMEVEFVSTDPKRPNTLTAWYAPNVGVIKQTSNYDGRITTIELTKFTPGK